MDTAGTIIINGKEKERNEHVIRGRESESG